MCCKTGTIFIKHQGVHCFPLSTQPVLDKSHGFYLRSSVTKDETVLAVFSDALETQGWALIMSHEGRSDPLNTIRHLVPNEQEPKASMRESLMKDLEDSQH